MTEDRNIELMKLSKKYKIFKKINTFLLYCAGLLLILMLLDSFGIVDLPFYKQNLPFSHRIFLNAWVGIPYKNTGDEKHRGRFYVLIEFSYNSKTNTRQPAYLSY